MSKVRFAFLGATAFSKELLKHLVSNGYKPVAIFTIPEEFTISYSEEKVRNTNFANLQELAKMLNIPCYEVDSSEGQRLADYDAEIKDLNLDLVLVLGWYYMVPKKVRDLATYGSWGIHASMLPKYAGGAPLNWAIINGENETGVTLFRMDDGVDDGDIIAQKSFSIEYTDTIRDVYSKATFFSKMILDEVFMDFNNLSFIPQDKDKIEVYPQRTPLDGEINFNLGSNELYNFIRAQSAPYPGAYFKTCDGKKIVIESARIESL